MNLEDVALSSYPAYFINSLLTSMGWPRRKGLLGRSGVEGIALGSAWTAVTQSAMGFGAGRPVLACQLLAHVLPQKDWSADSVDDFFTRTDPVKTIQTVPGSLPWETLVQPEIQIMQTFIPWNDVVSQEMFDVLTGRFVGGLVYGLMHPTEVHRALDTDRTRYATGAPEAVKHGLHIPVTPPFPDNESYFQWLEQTVRAFERRAGQLTPSPPQLLAARAVRVRAAV